MPDGLTPASCSPEHGRFDAEADEIADVDDPQMPAKVNAGWYRMAREFGLFDERREFLLLIDQGDGTTIEPDLAWLRVRLVERRDLASSGSTFLRSSFAALFTERFVPEFTTLSLDGKMILTTTVWGDRTVSTVVIRPDGLHRGVE